MLPKTGNVFPGAGGGVRLEMSASIDVAARRLSSSKESQMRSVDETCIGEAPGATESLAEQLRRNG